MKLYTEEQVIIMLNRGRLHKQDDTEMFTNEYLLSEETPIELPSDEEIKDKSFNNFAQSNARTCFEEGAKWMKSKILGNNHLGGISY